MDDFLNTPVPAPVADVAKNVSSATGIEENNLLWVFWHESRYNWQIVSNWGSFSTFGLIQFTSGTADALNLDTNRLISDLDYQEQAIIRYYNDIQKSRGKIGDAYELALANFYPAALGKPDSFVFPENVVSLNRPMFIYGNTKADYYKYLETKFPNTWDFWSKKKRTS